MPTVSVICPAYNAAAFIEPTLQSVLCQTFQDFEFIVVDDGSTDSTPQIVEKYRGRIQYLYKTNGGQSSARNAGIRVARGQYIAFIDHDDLWLENKLELQIGEISRSDAVGLVSSGTIWLNENQETGRSLSNLNNLTRKQLLKRLALGNIIGGCSNVLIRRECFLKLGLLDESLRMAEDWDMWLRVAEAYDIRSVPQPLVKYRWHARNFSNSSAEVNLTNELAFLKRTFTKDFFRNNRMLKRQAVARRYLAAAIAFREQRDYIHARQCVFTALRYYPPYLFKKLSVTILTRFR